MTTDTTQHVLMKSLEAVTQLAIGLGSLQQRLEAATDELLTLESREVPEGQREVFHTLLNEIMSATDMASLPDAAAVSMAQQILAFHEGLIATAVATVSTVATVSAVATVSTVSEEAS